MAGNETAATAKAALVLVQVIRAPAELHEPGVPDSVPVAKVQNDSAYVVAVHDVPETHEETMIPFPEDGDTVQTPTVARNVWGAWPEVQSETNA